MSTLIKIPISPDNPQPLGRSVEHDERSRQYAITSAPTSALETKTWPRYTPILDQSDLKSQGIILAGNPDALNSCTGNAGIGVIGTLPYYSKQDFPFRRQLRSAKLSEIQAIDLYAEATELDEFPDTYPPTDDGSSGLGVAKALLHRGLISSYSHAFGLQAVLTALQKGPVMLGIPWYESMFSAKPDGAVEISGAVAGGHEIVCDAIYLTEQVVRLANSWGKSWGDEGYFFLTFDQLDRLLGEQGDCTVLHL